MKRINIRNKKNFKGVGIYIGRPSRLGNPYSHLKGTLAVFKADSVEDSILKYKDYFYEQLKEDYNFKSEVERLYQVLLRYGELNIICWCHPRPCHGEVIKEYLEQRLKNDEKLRLENGT